VAHLLKGFTYKEGNSHLFTSCRELEFSETDFQYHATLCVRTGAKCPFALVWYLRSRYLDTPSHKNSLAVSENASSRQLSEQRCSPIL
jgi:hypothetical protein